MNNSRLVIDSVPLRLDRQETNVPQLRAREGQLTRVIEAVRKVQSSKEWSSLKTELFDGLTERLVRDLMLEAKKEIPDTLKLNRLAGQLRWAERYSDLSKLEQEFMTELTLLKQTLHGKTEKTG